MTDQHGATSGTTNATSQTHEKDNELERRNPLLSDMPDWPEELTKKFVDDRLLEFRDSHASSSHGPSFESWREVVSGTRSFYSH